MDPMLIILVLAFGAMWLMTSRTRKQQKKAAEFRSNLQPGQEVMTGSGLFGTVVGVDDDVITLETSPGVTSRWLRPAIAKLVDPPVVDDVDEDDAVPTTTPLSLGKDTTTSQVPDDASALTRDLDEGDDRRP